MFSRINGLRLVSAAVFFTFIATGICWCQESKACRLGGVEFLSGYGTGDLRRKKDYRMVPFFLDLDFPLKPLLAKKNINFPGLLQFVAEPFVTYVPGPEHNMEAGSNFLFKVGIVPETWVLQPYVKGGVGFLYMSQHTLEEGTQFNFNETIGGGVHYFFRKNTALTVEYRFRHLSNADIRLPNAGINTSTVVGGISWFF